jgi:two-component system chemotaxis sensor kinase CheA
MDIVKQRITELRGEVWVNTQKGIGTTFSIKIQQSIAIIDTLLFRVDQTFFTVPISEIAVCLQLKLVDLNARRNTSTIEFNNHLIPFVDLRHLFGLEMNRPDMTKIIIVRNEKRELAIIADDIIGEHQAVLKPLGSAFHGQKHITSASQMGDGNMAFMVDIAALLKERSY